LGKLGKISEPFQIRLTAGNATLILLDVDFVQPKSVMKKQGWKSPDRISTCHPSNA